MMFLFVLIIHIKQKLKNQLFKIIGFDKDNSKIEFYEGHNELNPYYIFYEKEYDTYTYSMVNFVVLKESLNFGFLSYGINEINEAGFTIFNMPTCKSFPTTDQKK